MRDPEVRAEVQSLRLHGHRPRHRGQRQVLLLCELLARLRRPGSARPNLNLTLRIAANLTLTLQLPDPLKILSCARAPHPVEVERLVEFPRPAKRGEGGAKRRVRGRQSDWP